MFWKLTDNFVVLKFFKMTAETGTINFNGVIVETGLVKNITDERKYYVYCMKLWGVIDGRLALVRMCGHGGNNLDKKCGPNVTLKLDGKDAQEKLSKYGCTCVDDECNGASRHRFNYLFLIFIAIYVMTCNN